MNIETFKKSEILHKKVLILKALKEHAHDEVERIYGHLSKHASEAIKSIVLFDLDSQISALEAEFEAL